jgi:hypothetical protein
MSSAPLLGALVLLLGIRRLSRERRKAAEFLSQP